MRGQWVSQTRKLNRHYQSMHTPTPAQKDFIVYTHAMRYSNEFQSHEQTVRAFNVDGYARYGGYYNWEFGDNPVGLYDFNILQADAGSEHSFTYRASDNDTLSLDLKYGLAPDYISPYLGGSFENSTASALGGKPRNIVDKVKVTLEIDITFTIDLLKLETDDYSAAGATYSKTFRLGDINNTHLDFPPTFDTIYIDANDSTNYLIDLPSVHVYSPNKISYTTVLNNASAWTQNKVPTQYKVNFYNDIPLRLEGYMNKEFVHCGVTQATGSTTIKLSIEEL